MSNPFEKSKILLVDDDNSLLLGLKKSLIKEDFIVEIAVDVEEAFSKTNSCRVFWECRTLRGRVDNKKTINRT